MMKRIIVVGLGSIGQRHARLLAGRADVTVEVCDASSDMLHTLHALVPEAVQHTNYQKALLTKPDIVFLCTPTRMHKEQVLEALQAGAHVFCEKPMTDSLTAAKALVHAATEQAMQVNIGFHLHFHQGLMAMKALISSGKIGKLVHIHARVGTYVTLANSKTRYQREVIGSLFSDYTHQFDLIYWLTGKKPSKVFAQGGEFGALPLSSNPNLADIMFVFDDEFQAHIHLNYIQAPQRHQYEMVGTEGWAFLDVERSLLEIGYSDGHIETMHVEQERDDIYRAEHNAFLKAISEHGEQESPPESALISTAIAEAVMTATGRQAWQTILY